MTETSEGWCKLCVGADISCFIPYKEIKFSTIVPSFVTVAFTDQDFDLTLNWPSNIMKWRSQLVILTKSFSQLLIKESNSSDLRDLYEVIMQPFLF